MRLIGFSVENFKAVGQQVRLGPLNALNAIVGPNNEGKSSLIEALYLTRHLKEALNEGSRDPNTWVTDRLPGKDRTRKLTLGLEFELEREDVPGDSQEAEWLRRAEISVELGWGPQIPGGSENYLYLKGAWIRSSESDVAPVQLIENTPTRTDGRSVSAEPQTSLSIIANRLVTGGDASRTAVAPEELRGRTTREESTDASSGDWLSMIGQWTDRLIMVPPHRPIDVIGAGTVGSAALNGQTLPALLSRMVTNQGTRFREFESLIASLVGGSIRRLYVHNEGGGNVSIRVAPSEVNDTQDAFRLDTVGGGINEIIYLAAVIWFSPPRSVILVEEPERGLHTSSQRRLVSSVLDQALTQQKQVFWATHSTAMAPLRANCSVFMSTLAEPTRVVITDIGNESAQQLLTALGHSNVDFYAYDVVILVDGETEAEAIPTVIAATLGDAAAAAVLVEDVGGDLRSRRDLVRRILEMVRDTRINPVILADDDEGARAAVDEFVRGGLIQRDAVHIWDCGVSSSTGGGRTAEFEDNFSLAELVAAANQLGGGDVLDQEQLAGRLREGGATKISKVLEHYYFEEYGAGWSKPRLGQALAARIGPLITAGGARGNGGNGLELEEVLRRTVGPSFIQGD